MKTTSRIDTPRNGGNVAAGEVAIGGVAWTQRGIRGVEVQVDDGEWADAELSNTDTIDTWRQWIYRWQASAGRHTIRVRATDSRGETQAEEETDPFPDGATGWHTISVAVA